MPATEVAVPSLASPASPSVSAAHARASCTLIGRPSHTASKEPASTIATTSSAYSRQEPLEGALPLPKAVWPMCSLQRPRDTSTQATPGEAADTTARLEVEL